MRTFDTGATRDDCVNKIDPEAALSPLVLRRYCEYVKSCRVIQENGVVRSDDNWQKGFPIEQSMKSLLRHVLTVWEQHRTSELDEDTLCAVIFNAQCVLHSLLVDKSATIVSENDTYKPNSSTDCPKCDDVFATKPPERIFTTMYSGVYKGQRVAVYKYCPVCFGTGYYEDRSIPGSQITCRCVVPMHEAEHATDCPKCDGIGLQKAGEGYEMCDACNGSGKR